MFVTIGASAEDPEKLTALARMNSAEDIQSVNHHMRIALDQITDGVLILEAESSTPIGPRIVYANRSVQENSGYQLSDLLGQPLGLLFDRDFLPQLVQNLPSLAYSNEAYRMNCDLHTKDGGRECYEWSILPVKDSQGLTVNFTIRFSPLLQMDEAELEAKQQAQLQHDIANSRLESLQIVSSGIAHDFRNGLATAKMAIDLARSHCHNNPEALSYLEDALLSIDANSDLASQMLDFTQGEESKPQVLNLHGLLQKTSRMATVGKNVNPELSIQEDLWDVEVDPVQIQQVLQNIIINGCQAMPNGGPMHITARNASVSAGNQFQLDPGHYVVIGIRDRGHGIPRNALERVFDPYFSTKADGTGIGLASCKQIIERHRGRISVESAENVGTEFLIILPIAAAGTSTPPQPAIQQQQQQAQQVHARATQEFLAQNQQVSSYRRALIVDDDPQILKLASKIISHLGMEAVACLDGENALHQVRQAFCDAQSFDVVIIDLNLPRINGRDLMYEIRKADPSVRVILSTGDAQAATDQALDWDGVLSKPYGKEAMETTIMQAIQKVSHHHGMPVM